MVCKIRKSGSSFTRLHVVTDMPVPFGKFCILAQLQSVSKDPVASKPHSLTALPLVDGHDGAGVT